MSLVDCRLPVGSTFSLSANIAIDFVDNAVRGFANDDAGKVDLCNVEEAEYRPAVAGLLLNGVGPILILLLGIGREEEELDDDDEDEALCCDDAGPVLLVSAFSSEKTLNLRMVCMSRAGSRSRSFCRCDNMGSHRQGEKVNHSRYISICSFSCGSSKLTKVSRCPSCAHSSCSTLWRNR